MVAKITSGGKGSCIGLAQYLEKEVQGNWFSHDKDAIHMQQVVSSIDANKKNLGHQDDKYYQVIISPSQSELTHIGNDRAKLEGYTKATMQHYADQFGKGIKSSDLVWFAKIENERSYSQSDKSVQQQERSKGESKEGHQTHVHIIVSRTENLERYHARKQAGEIQRKNPLKLSPATNHRSTVRGAVQGGFDRTGFKEVAERQFDQQFKYDRPLSETFQYANTMQKGSQEERVALRAEALRQEQTYLVREQPQERTQRAEQEQTRQQQIGGLSF